jgi:hypothetical protein
MESVQIFFKKKIKVFPLNFKIKAPKNCSNFNPSANDIE